MIVIELGYLFGILSKFVDNNLTYVLVFYIINVCMVFFDIVLYFINRRRDRMLDELAQP